MNIDEKRRALAARLQRTATEHSAPSASPAATGRRAVEAPLDPIAIVGVAGEFPQCESVRALWRAFDEDRSLITPIPADRFALEAGFVGAWGGFLTDVRGFDAGMFNVPSGFADLMDPRQRLLLMSVHHALEDAGYAPSALRESATGVFVAAEEDEYAAILAAAGVSPSEMPSPSASLLANSISYFFDWRGPSEYVNTMCSGAAVALHRAVVALRSGEIDNAVVAGVNVILSPAPYLALARSGQMSPSPVLHSFGAGARGFLRSEGAAAVFLKTLSAARRDGDSVYAVIRNSAVNYNGRGGTSIAAPDIRSHVDVIRACYGNAGIDVRDLGYIEGQGMANPVADIAEWEAFNRALRALAEKQGVSLEPGRCVVGTLKPALGHMHAASALGGLMRILRIFQTRRIPPILHFAGPHPDLTVDGQPCRLAASSELWTSQRARRLAGLHSYGSGGNNAHLLFEEVAEEREVGRRGTASVIVPISARTPRQCAQILAALVDAVLADPTASLPAVAWTMQSGRDVMDARIAVVASDTEHFVRAARRALGGELDPDVFRSGEPGDVAGAEDAGSARAVAAAWVRGEKTEWSRPAERHARLHLPGYPFDRKSHWAPMGRASSPDIGRAAGAQGATSPSVVIASSPSEMPSGDSSRVWAEKIVREVIGSFLAVPPADVDLSRPLSDAGFDSTMVTSLVARLGARHAISLPPAELFELGTPRALVERIAALRARDGADGPVGAGSRGEDAPASGHDALAPIAIVGLAGRFPKAPTLETFWENLRAGVDAVGDIPCDRWGGALDRYFEPDPKIAVASQKTYGKWAGFLDGAEDFDPLFFHISPLEAESMNPKERLFLECAWHAIEDAGYAPEALARDVVGVFVGATRTGPDPYYLSAFPIANRVSYLLNLRGPSVPVDTACSSSLVALHLACQAIRAGECSAAIAGGVHTFLGPAHFIALSRTAMLAPDGRCRSFGDGANGMVPGEGVGAVVLKPLAAALRDGDHVYGVVRGSATNHGGKANGFTMPNPRAHRDVIAGALRNAGVRPERVSYVEAHGTGTALGDPIEVRGLSEAFRGDSVPPQSCRLGSVKSNIGHLEAAAGISGLTKILLQLKHRELTPSLHSEALNPLIDFAATPFRVQRALEPWDPCDGDGRAKPRVACLSSFGAGGSNAHVVIEEAPARERAAESAEPQVIVLSARTPRELEEVARRLLSHIERSPSETLRDVAYTLQVGRRPLDERVGLVATSLSGASEKIRAFLAGDVGVPGLHSGRSTGADPSLVALVQDEDGGKVVDAWIAKGKLEQIVQLWVKGVDIDWQLLHTRAHPAPRRVSLPGYPFARERFPVPQAPLASAPIPRAIELHPLVQVNTSSFAEQRYESTFSGDESFLRDHVVLGERVLPGVVYLEMAIQAVLAAREARPDFPREAVRLSRVTWLQPFKVLTEPEKATIRLSADDEHEIGFEIASGEERARVHAQGRAAVVTEEGGARLDLEALRAECAVTRVEPQALYAAFAAFGIRYGGAHQALATVEAGRDQVLAEIVLPPEVVGEGSSYLIHPSLADAALQATLAVLIDPEEIRTIPQRAGALGVSLPFALDALEIRRPCPARVFAWVRRSSQADGAGPVHRLDVDVCDADGDICVRFRGFSLRTAEPARVEADEATPPAGMLSMTPVWSELTLEERAARRAPLDRSLPTLLVGGTAESTASLRAILTSLDVVEGGADVAQAEWDARIGMRPEWRHFVFVAGGEAAGDARDCVARQADGVVRLFRFVKAILAADLGRKKLALTVVTTQAQAVERGEEIDPAHASIHGLVGSLAKEYPHWTVRLFDLERGVPWPLAEMFDFGGDPHGNALAHRGGAWLREDLLRVKDLAPVGEAYRPDGTYVIVGGAGGIGRVFTRHLIESARAQVVWIGRRAQDEEITANLAELAALSRPVGGPAGGPPPVYLRADATSAESLEGARAEILARFGRIDAVVHSAIVLRDQSVAKMTEEALRDVLAAKVDVAVRIAHVFRDAQLVFFSSMQSFVKTPGQSNYSAGCTFGDAYARWLAARGAHVKVVNWGFWGSVGVVATKDHQERMAKVGMGSIEPPEGMAALADVMRGPLQQVVVMKTSRAVVPAGMSPSEWMTCVPGAPLNAVALDSFTPSAPARIQAPTPAEEHVQRAMLEFMMDALYAELAALGAFESARRPRAERRDGTDWVPSLDGWMAESLCILSDAGYPTSEDGTATALRSASPTRETVWRRFESLKETWGAHAQVQAQLALLEAMLRALPRILRGEVPPTDVMFPGSSLALVEGIHKGNDLTDAFNAVVAEAAAAFVERRIADDPAARVRILEIGAGTGGTSAVVLERLKSFHDHLAEYAYTDLSAAFLMHGQRVFAPGNSFLRTAIFDVEQPLASAGIVPGSYDLVIAANVLHATKNVRRTVRNAKATLARGGLLLVHEMSANNLFSHLTFGLLEGWWRYEDAHVRLRGCPALAPESWRRVLRDEGFARVHFPAEAHHHRGLQVVVAESDGVIRQRHAGTSAAKASGATKALGAQSTPTHARLAVQRQASASSRGGRDLRARATAFVIEQMARTLKMSADSIDPETPFERYGIDSIVVVQLTTALDEALGDIKSTFLFEHPSVAAVVEHLVATRGESLDRALGAHGSEADRAPAAGIVAPPARLVPVSRKRVPAPRARAVAEPSRRGRDVAIIGLAGRYPDARDVAGFWDNLKSGRNCVGEIPRTRWDWRRYFSDERGKWGSIYTKWGAFIEGAERFDPLFFQISPREAEGMDPQERLFLETSYHCIEDAGYTPAALSEARAVGVFVGVMNANYPTGTRYWSIANRVSYLLDLRGPSVAVDTACSSSLTAIHMAVESVRNGSSDCAIAGGVNLIVAPFHYMCLTQMNMVSAGDKNGTFSATADGFVDGEGVGAVLLKPLARAIEDGDHIYGVIRGSAISHGGKTNGYTVPNPTGQARLVATALRDADVNPRTVSYVEAHGTGTVLGDPIEIAGLTRAFEEWTAEKGFCAIGSVKSNIGHGESAAGIAGLTKVLLQMQHGEIAPSLHCDTLNPHIDFARTPFVVNHRLSPWRRPVVDGREQPRRAGISSFGAGGANAHVVIEEPPADERGPSEAREPRMFVLSAKVRERLEVYAERLAEFVASAADGASSWFMTDLAFTLQVGREPMDARLGVIASTPEELCAGLRSFLAGRDADTSWIYGTASGSKAIVQSLFGDGGTSASLKDWTARGELHKVLRLWTMGVAIDWAALADGGPQARRLSAPTYPFKGDPFWVRREDVAGPSREAEESERASDTVCGRPVWQRVDAAFSEENAPLSRRDLIIVVAAQGDLASTLGRAPCAAEASAAVLTFDADEEQMSSALERGLSALLRALTDLLAANPKREVRVTVLSTGGDEIAALTRAVAAYLASVRCEHPEISVKVIDVDAEVARDEDRLDVVLRQELRDELQADGHVRYRHGLRERQVERFESYELPAAQPAGGATSARDVVWISGGSGRIATHVARGLALAGGRVFLLGRAPLESVRARIGDVLGEQVEYHRVDVTDRDALRGLLEHGRQRGLALKGIIHAAAVLEDARFEAGSSAQIGRVLAPKARGIERIDEVTRDEPLEYFVAFSSLAAVTGNLGQSVYAAANAFLDGFMETRHAMVQRGIRSGRSLSIAWPYWEDGGMSLNATLLEHFKTHAGMVPLSAHRGVAALARLIAGADARRVVVNEVDRAFTRALWLRSLFGGTVRATEPRASAVTEVHAPPAAPPADIVGVVHRILASVTKLPVDSVRDDAHFAEMGIDSILMMALVKELQKALGVQLYVSEIQGLPSVAALVAYLKREVAEQGEGGGAPAPPPSAGASPPASPMPIVSARPAPASSRRAARTLVVLGTPRGGSTLLRVMLQNNPKLFSPPELYLLGHQTMRARAAEMTAKQQSFLREGLIVALHALRGGPVEDAKAVVAGMERDDASIADVYQHLRTYLPSDQYLVDKTPMYAQSLETLQQAERDLELPVYIYLYRHPLSVMSSLVKNRFHKMLGIDSDPWRFAEHVWRQWNQNIHAFLGSVPTARQIHVPYEAMVTDPEPWMRYLCARLSIPYDERMVKPYAHLEGAMVGGTTEDSLMIGDPNFLKHESIDPNLAFAWQKHVTRWPALEETTRALAREMGYSDAGDNFANWTRVSGGRPALPAQIDFLRLHGDDPVWHIVSRITFETRPPHRLDETSVRARFHALLERQPVLRTCFDAGADFRQEVGSVEGAVDRLIWVDARAVGASERERLLETLAADARARIDLRTGAVLTVVVARLEEARFAAIVAAHHLVADGVSVELITQALFGIDRNGARAPEGHIDERQYLQYLAIHRVPSALGCLVAEGAHRVEGEAARPQGGACLPNTCALEVEHHREARRRLATTSIEWEAVALSLHQCLATVLPDAALTIAHRFHCRNLFGGTTVAADIGYYANDLPITLPRELFADGAKARQHLRERRLACVLGGAEHQLLVQVGRARPAQEIARVRLNYQPYEPLQSEHLILGAVDTSLHSPPSHARPYDLDCILKQLGDRLRVTIRYNKEQFAESVIARLVAEWLDALGLGAAEGSHERSAFRVAPSAPRRDVASTANGTES